MIFQPAAGWRHVAIRTQRTKADFVWVMKEILDHQFADAKTLRVVMDHVNTHTPASLSEVFAPAEARRLASTLDIHDTPKHASWLDMAEIEISVLKQQCLDRRMATEDRLQHEMVAWETPRNHQHVTVEWQFTTQHARHKLKRLYPIIQQDEETELTCQN